MNAPSKRLEPRTLSQEEEWSVRETVFDILVDERILSGAGNPTTVIKPTDHTYIIRLVTGRPIIVMVNRATDRAWYYAPSYTEVKAMARVLVKHWWLRLTWRGSWR